MSLALAGWAAAACGDDGPAAPTTGSLQVTAATTGSDVDPDGYSVTAGGQTLTVASAGTVTFSDLAAGDYSVQLSGVAVNCGVDGVNPRTVAVVAGQTAQTSFDVACATPLSNQIVFVSNRAQGGDNQIYVMGANGSNVTQLTTEPGDDFDPAISPDGTRIAFASNRDGDFDIYIMLADGAIPVQLTTTSASDRKPAWSPDGTQIAFERELEIYVMDADGSNPVNITNDPATDQAPSWSPGGTQIAFVSGRDGSLDIHVMNADGSGAFNLTADAATDQVPAWRPGTRIAFAKNVGSLDFDIHVIDAAQGATAQNLTTADAAIETTPVWSPGGTQIAFARLVGARFDIHVMNADGSAVSNLTQSASSDDSQPSWSPP